MRLETLVFYECSLFIGFVAKRCGTRLATIEKARLPEEL